MIIKYIDNALTAQVGSYAIRSSGIMDPGQTFTIVAILFLVMSIMVST